MLKKTIKSSLDFALIVFSFLVGGGGSLTLKLTLFHESLTRKITKHSAGFLYKNLLSGDV